MTTQINIDNIQPSALPYLGGGPKIANIQVANSTYVANGSSNISTSGGYAIINGTNFQSNVNVVLGNTLATSVAYVSSIRLNVQVPALTAGNYIVYVTNTDNGKVAVKPNGIIIV
jgi:hypothetical protein